MKETISKFMGNLWYKEHEIFINGEDMEFFLDIWSEMRKLFKLSDSLISLKIVRTTSKTVKYKMMFSLTKNAWRYLVDEISNENRKLVLLPNEELYLY